MRKKPAARSAQLLDGRAVADKSIASLAKRVAWVAEQRGEAPLLAILSVGRHAAAEAYLKQKLEACKSASIETTVQSLPASISQAEAVRVLDDLAKDLHVDGIIIDMPLPPGLDLHKLLDRIPPEKDVEGVTASNYGRLFAIRKYKELDGVGTFVPCTAAAVIALVQASGVETEGQEAVVVGRSNIVGKPAAHLLSTLGATVTLCHSGTKDLRSHLRRADIVVAAAGRPGIIKGSMLKRGALVIDAGVSYLDGSAKGDVDFASARKTARWLTPVPGGVGPVTIAALLSNAVLAAERRSKARLGV